MNKRQAILEVRSAANWIIEQAERRAKGWDKGVFRDDVREVDKCWATPIEVSIQQEVDHAFALSREFGSAPRETPANAGFCCAICGAGFDFGCRCD